MDHSVDPPPLSITIPKLVDQQVSCKPWEFIRHPTDVLLLTVADDEFLNCFFYFHNAFRSYKYGLGYVYFGEIDDGPGSIKVSLIRCCSGSSSPGASHNVAKNAIQCLRPKAVFSVGFCSGLRKDKIELGDVVISAKLSTYSDKKIIDDQEQWCGHTLQVSRNIGDLIRSAADGWKAPLNDPEAREVKVHRDAEVLTGPELANSLKTSEELRKEFPGAVAIEAEGQGVYAAAFDSEIEWVIIKGISHYTDSSCCGSDKWQHFASAMAASVVKHILKEPIVLQDWPCYKGVHKDSLNQGITKNPTLFCELPLKPSHHVIEREETVKEFEEKMRLLRENNPNSVTRLCLSGNPGCGKTQLARLLANSIKSTFSFVYTLDALSQEHLYQSLYTLARKLGCSAETLNLEVSSKKDFYERFRMLCYLVGSKASSLQPWLLIVDGIGVRGLDNKVKFWRNPIIQGWGHGQVIITTQRSDDAPNAESLKTGLNEENSTELLKRVSHVDEKHGSDMAEGDLLKQIAKELDYQPLALVLAAMYVKEISETTTFTWRDYHHKLCSGKRERMENDVAEMNISYCDGMVAASRLVVEQLAVSSEILKYTFLGLSFCVNSLVPVDLLVQFVIDNTKDTDTEHIQLILRRCCLFISTKQYEVNSLKVHQVIHDRFMAFRNESKEDLSAKWLKTMETFAKKKIQGNKKDSSTFSTLSLLKSHIPMFHVSSHKSKQTFSLPTNSKTDKPLNVDFDNLQFISKLQVFRDVFFTIIDTENSLMCNNCILEVQKALYGSSHDQIASTLANQGYIYRKQGNLQKAEEYYNDSLNMTKSSSDKAEWLHNLGWVYRDGSDLKKALECYMESLQKCKEIYGESHPSVADRLHSLGVIYLAWGDVKEAESLHQKSLDMNEKFHGKSHHQRGDTLHSLGVVYLVQGDLKKAEECHLESLTIKQTFYGESHPKLPDTMTSLGAVYLAWGSLEKAERYIQESSQMNKKFHCISHPVLAMTLYNLGIVYDDSLDRAEHNCVDFSGLERKTKDENYPKLAETKYSLGEVYLARGELEKAEQQYLQCLEVIKEFYGENHPVISLTLHNLGVIYRHMGNIKKALVHYRESMEMTGTFQRKNHPIVAAAWHNLGVICHKCGYLEQAERYLLKSLTANKTLHGESHPRVAHTLYSLGILYHHWDDIMKVEEHFQKSVAMYKHFFGENNPKVVGMLRNWKIHRDQRKREKAE